MSDSAVPTTNVEKRIVDKLADFYRPMRLIEIVTALGIHKEHCIDLLKNLVALVMILYLLALSSHRHYLCLHQIIYVSSQFVGWYSIERQHKAIVGSGLD